jgi:hypothetical protein
MYPQRGQHSLEVEGSGEANVFNPNLSGFKLQSWQREVEKIILLNINPILPSFEVEKLARSLNMKLVKTSVKENLNVGKVSFRSVFTPPCSISA